MRTNEELALLAQQGDREALEQLWRQNQGLLCKLFTPYFKYCQQCRCEPDDLLQCGYMVIVAAAKAYDPAKNWKFTAYLRRGVQNAAAETLGYRGTKQRPVEVSGSTPIGDEGGDIELLDLQPDPCAGEAFESAQEDVYTQQLHQTLQEAMERVTERQRAIITRRFYQGDTYSTIAADYGLGVESIRREQQNGLCKMSRHRPLREYRADIISHAARRVGLGTFRNSGLSAVEWATEMLQRTRSLANQ